MTRYEEYKQNVQEIQDKITFIKKEITKTKKDKKLPIEVMNSKIESLNKEQVIVKKELDKLRRQLIQYLSFKVDEDLKIEFLKLKPFKTAKSDLPAIMALDEFEDLIGKKAYNFTLSERDELLMMKFRNTTIGAINSTMSKIKGYIDYCVRTGAVNHNQNIFDTLTKAEAQKFVSQRATDLRYISPEQLQKFQNTLVNYQDKLLLECPYVGIRGRTKKGATLEEIINLQYNPLKKYSDGLITLERNKIKNKDNKLDEKGNAKRLLKIPSKTWGLIEMAYNDNEYLSNNGVKDERKDSTIKDKSIINRVENYVFRSTGKNNFEKLNSVTINARFQKIQDYCGNQYITIHNLYMSGMISRAIEIYKEKGEITVDDYLKICDDFKYGDTPNKYYIKVKQDVELYLKGEIADA